MQTAPPPSTSASCTATHFDPRDEIGELTYFITVLNNERKPSSPAYIAKKFVPNKYLVVTVDGHQEVDDDAKLEGKGPLVRRRAALPSGTAQGDSWRQARRGRHEGLALAGAHPYLALDQYAMSSECY